MKLLDNLERKYGRYGIQNLTMWMIVCYVVGYLLYIVSPVTLSYLGLNVSMILRGQIWRLVTWVIYPPDTSNVLLFAISVLFFYYPVGNALEKTMGRFRYTVYILSGLVFTVIGAFIFYGITGGILDQRGFNVFTTYYISMSVFLAFAALYPNMQILLWFVIPIKMKWMAYVYSAILLYDMITYVRRGVWYLIIPVLASLLNFLLFFLSMRNRRGFHPGEMKRRREFHKAMEPQSRAEHKGQSISKHKCAICGQTELDNPDLEFRFCSKCNGNYEYCQNHLFTHTHVK